MEDSGKTVDELAREIERLRHRVKELEVLAGDSQSAVKALSNSEHKYKTLVQSISEYLYSVEFQDGKQVSVYHSPQCQSITGYSSDEYYDDPELWFKMVHPDDRNLVTRFFRDIKAHKTRKPISHRITRKDGVVRWVSNHCAVTLGDKGEILRQDGFLLDITDLMEAEDERDRLYAAIEQSAEVIMITDLNGVIQYVNPVFERITGYSRQEALGQTPRLLKSGQQPPELYDELWNVITSGNVWEGNFINKRKDGSLYQETATISPIKNQKGEVVNFVAVKRDVTRETMLVKAREYFTAVTSHELRTPLIKLDLVRMLLASLAEKLAEKEALERIATVLDNVYSGIDSVVSATSLITELSTVKSRESFVRIAIYHDISTCLDSLKHMLTKEKRNLSVSIDLSGIPKNTQIMGEQLMLARAVHETLSNAAKYTPDGKTIHVRGIVEDGRPVLEIADEGIGIPKEMQEQVFEPYFSLENPIYYSSSKHKFKGGGIGLGLTVARMIMQFHDGALKVKSEGENQGSTVRLIFPPLVAKSGPLV
ncbi:MAG: PAS domain S-box protein [Nitrospinae bacterium]|nr:PAS domain S-box protein [Nitrospinota bacterium]